MFRVNWMSTALATVGALLATPQLLLADGIIITVANEPTVMVAHGQDDSAWTGYGRAGALGFDIYDGGGVGGGDYVLFGKLTNVPKDPKAPPVGTEVIVTANSETGYLTIHVVNYFEVSFLDGVEVRLLP